MINRQRYTTHAWHDKFPVGTQCWITRNGPDTLTLEYDDGTVIELGSIWYAKGLEEQGTHIPLELIFFDSVAKKIAEDIDRQVLTVIFKDIK